MSDKTELIEVECCNCKRKFNKTLHRYKEAKKYGWNFFCSKECHSRFKNKSLKMKCFVCGKDIDVLRNRYGTSLSKKFFCSSSCSAKHSNKVRGPRNEKEKENIRNGLIKYYDKKGRTLRFVGRNCLICGKLFRVKEHKKYCCSRNCYWIYKVGSMPYTKDDVLNIVVNIGNKTGRTPQRRDCEIKLYHAAVRFFGTWNKAMEACNLKPNHSKYQKIRLRCSDGHMADSISEKIIDEWLFSKGIKHERNKKYPKSNMNCDFYLVDHNVWVEYFGLYGGDIADYDNTIKLKERLVKENNLDFISIKPSDLYGDKTTSYDDKIKKMFCKILTT